MISLADVRCHICWCRFTLIECHMRRIRQNSRDRHATPYWGLVSLQFQIDTADESLSLFIGPFGSVTSAALGCRAVRMYCLMPRHLPRLPPRYFQPYEVTRHCRRQNYRAFSPAGFTDCRVINRLGRLSPEYASHFSRLTILLTMALHLPRLRAAGDCRLFITPSISIVVIDYDYCQTFYD